MLCDRCNKNPATIHIVKIVNGVKQEMNLCESCARTEGDLNFKETRGVDEPLYFQNLLSGILDYMTNSVDENKTEGIVCPNCGMTYKEFKEKSEVGCEECYKVFSKKLAPMIKQVQKSDEHIGKVPHNGGRKLINKRNLLKLKEELQKAILEEEYENAAVIRDKIKELQSQEDRGETNGEKLD